MKMNSQFPVADKENQNEEIIKFMMNAYLWECENCDEALITQFGKGYFDDESAVEPYGLYVPFSLLKLSKDGIDVASVGIKEYEVNCSYDEFMDSSLLINYIWKKVKREDVSWEDWIEQTGEESEGLNWGTFN